MIKRNINRKRMIQSQKERWYLLRVINKPSSELSLSLFGGLSDREKTLSDIKEEAEKAFRSGYSRILFPWNFIFHSEKEKIIKWCSENPQFFVLSVHKSTFKYFEKNFEHHLSEQFFLNLVLEDDDSEILDKIENKSWVFQITVPAHKQMDIYQLGEFLLNRYKNKKRVKLDDKHHQINFEKKNYKIKSLFMKIINMSVRYQTIEQPFRPLIYFHFPCFHKEHPLLYNSRDIYHFLKKHFYPAPQADIYNLSIPSDLKLDSERKPEFFHCISEITPLVSVIITSYNSAQELCLTLKHLFQQDLDKKKWEVIVVDDGSEDHTEDILKNLQFLSRIHFKYIFFPRERRREGYLDHRFRAGLARNLGVKESRGHFLFFLDSDILTPPFYLSSACKQLEKEDVIQHPRYHLIESAPKEYNQIDKNKHTFVRGAPYWENFYATGQEWNRKRLPWKYISTNTLCLESSVFKKVGWFRKNYTCYGFEDTDLGYRLYQSGFHFKINPVDTYHLYRSSEILNSIEVKEKLLGQSAKLFFHNTHCLEAYEEFHHLIERRDPDLN